MKRINSVSKSFVKSTKASLAYVLPRKKPTTLCIWSLSLDSFISVVTFHYTKRTDSGLWWEKKNCLWLILPKTNKTIQLSLLVFLFFTNSSLHFRIRGYLGSLQLYNIQFRVSLKSPSSTLLKRTHPLNTALCPSSIWAILLSVFNTYSYFWTIRTLGGKILQGSSLWQEQMTHDSIRKSLELTRFTNPFLPREYINNKNCWKKTLRQA